MTQTSGENILHPYRIAPGPRGNFLFGSACKIQRDPLQFGLTMTHQYGDIVRLRFLLWPAYLVNHPDSVKYVLQENQRNYNKDIYPYRVFQPLLLTSIEGTKDAGQHGRYIGKERFCDA